MAATAGRRWRPDHWPALAGFALLACLQTWPLVTDPAHLARTDNADTELNAWAVCWVAHAIVHDPLRLFDGNVFYPAEHSLAFSEPLIVPGLMGAPLRWLGASPVLTYNVLLLLGLTLTGFATYLLAVSIWGDRVAGVLAGILFAFSTHHLTRLPHLQALHAQWLPFALLALDRLLTRGQTRYAVALGLCVAAAGYTSGYLAVFTIVAVGTAFVASAESWLGARFRIVAPRLVLAGAIAAILLLPVTSVYARVRADQGFERSLEDLIAATPLTYLTSASWIHYETWSHYLYGDGSDTFFPGVVAVVLALGSIVTSRQTWLNPRVRSVLAVGIVGFLLSLGAATPLYGWLYSVFPPMWGMRAASRFGNLTLLAVAVLAGWGLARLRERWGDWRWALPLTVATLIVANVEARHGTTYVPFEGIPDLYKLIAADEHAVVAAFPFYMPPDTPMNGREMVASTAHFRPLLNGYSGFTPQSYRDAADVLWWFPSPESFDLLARRKVRYLVLHLSRYDPSEQESILQTLAGRHELHLLRVDKAQELRLYRFDYEAHAAAAAPASSGGS